MGGWHRGGGGRVNASVTTLSMEAQTRAERMRMPLANEVVIATAEQHGVCIRPFTMEVGDTETGELRYVAMPCGSTIESVCGPCARKARALRMTQCREGWHLADEPVFERDEPNADQTAQLTYRADLVKLYRESVDAGELDQADELREAIHEADAELRQLGVRGKLPSPDAPGRRPVSRSTKRRQDAPNLPRRAVAKTTVGREYAGRFRPSMFVTLTCDTYGRVRDDGTPVHPDSYDYRRAARDAVHFSSLVDRWWQNLRRVVGWDAQYFATVEPQRRAAPHLHTAIRGSIPHQVIRQVTAATYHQVWWPAHDELRFSTDHGPVWEPQVKGFVDPDTPRAADALGGCPGPGGRARAHGHVRPPGALQGHPRWLRRDRPAHRVPDEIPRQERVGSGRTAHRHATATR
jgi:hypothetical protein